MAEENWRPGLSLDNIRAFELRHGLALPDEYRRLLLQHDGGRLSRRLSGPAGASLLLFQLFRLEFAEAEAGTFFNSIARFMLPIGDNGGGDYYLLDLRDGSVRYWNHHSDAFRAESDELPVVAGNMTDLLNA